MELETEPGRNIHLLGNLEMEMAREQLDMWMFVVGEADWMDGNRQVVASRVRSGQF